MISYTIISQEQYSRLIEQNEQCLMEKAIVEKDNIDMKQQIKMLKNWLKLLRDQFKTEKSQNLHLLSHLRLSATKLNQIHEKLNQSTQTLKNMKNQQNETTLNMSKLYQYKTLLEQQNSLLSEQIQRLNQEITKRQQESLNFIKNQQILQSQITQLNLKINRIGQQNIYLSQQLKNHQQKLNYTQLQLQQKSSLLQKINIQYEKCKQQKAISDEEVQKFRQSPIPKLEEIIKAKQTWINELTKTISQLRQKCIELEMMNNPQQQKFQSKTLLINVGINNKSIPPSSNSVAPYQLATNTQVLQSSPIVAPIIASPIQPTFIQQQRQRQEQLQRIRYLTICRQLAKEFTKKLGKIQQQKKLLQQKYQTIRLKLNEYQYNEFRYKDKINLYVQKIQRFQKLTKKQQEEMQRLIEQFDQELNNMLIKKQNEVKMKFQEEIEKYQIQLQKRLKQDEQFLLKRSQSSPQNHQSSSMIKQKYLFTDDPFELQLFKLQLEQVKMELNQKYQQNQQLKNENLKLKKQLEKVRASKENYKRKFLSLEQQCYEKSTELRRCKAIVQQLYHQLQIKTNELQIVKKQWLRKKTDSGSSSNSQQNNQNLQDAFQSLSAKLSSENNQRHTLKRENSEYWEYQVSQIDTQGQRKNQTLLNNLIVGKLGCYNNIFRKQFNGNLINNSPGLPIKISQISDPQTHQQCHKKSYKNPAVNESMDSIHKSQISSLSSSESVSLKTQSSPNNSSFSSKNSYQSYGIKYLYTQKLTQNGKRFLMHKNSLQ